MNRHQRGNADAFRVQLADAMPGRFGRDHGNIHAGAAAAICLK